MTNIIADLAMLADEPIVSDENERTLKEITAITKTAEFEPMELDDEKLDELIDCLREQEEFAKEIPTITQGLQRVPSIVLPSDDEDEEEYI